jgi:shikimate dehydrogenase
MRAWSPQVLSHGLAPDDLKIQDLLKRVDFLINATSLGLQASDPLPITLDGLNPNAVVCDLVYRPGGTFFSNLAKEKGWASMGGLPMLVHQGALAFEVWTGQKGPVQVMAEALQRV